MDEIASRLASIFSEHSATSELNDLGIDWFHEQIHIGGAPGIGSPPNSLTKKRSTVVAPPSIQLPESAEVSNGGCSKSSVSPPFRCDVDYSHHWPIFVGYR